MRDSLEGVETAAKSNRKRSNNLSLRQTEEFSFLFNLIVPSADLSTSPRALKNCDSV